MTTKYITKKHKCHVCYIMWKGKHDIDICRARNADKKKIQNKKVQCDVRQCVKFATKRYYYTATEGIAHCEDHGYIVAPIANRRMKGKVTIEDMERVTI